MLTFKTDSVKNQYYIHDIIHNIFVDVVDSLGDVKINYINDINVRQIGYEISIDYQFNDHIFTLYLYVNQYGGDVKGEIFNGVSSISDSTYDDLLIKLVRELHIPFKYSIPF